jgi:hypothetical protein
MAAPSSSATLNVPAPLTAVAPKVERHGVEADQLLRETFHCRAELAELATQDNPIDRLWSGDGWPIAVTCRRLLGPFPLS